VLLPPIALKTARPAVARISLTVTEVVGPLPGFGEAVADEEYGDDNARRLVGQCRDEHVDRRGGCWLVHPVTGGGLEIFNGGRYGPC
jgi:hypothetical protein